MLLVDARVWIASGASSERYFSAAAEMLRNRRNPVATLDLTLYEVANTLAGKLGQSKGAEAMVNAMLIRCCDERLHRVDGELSPQRSRSPRSTVFPSTTRPTSQLLVAWAGSWSAPISASSSPGASPSPRTPPSNLGAVSVLEQVQSDVRTAMKARERERAGALRLVVDVLQQDAKLGKGDEVAVLQRERKKRIEAAEAYEGAGRAEQAAAERFEAELIEGYLPQQLSDEELAALVDEAIAETGATEQRQMGEVMSALMPKLGGRADGKRVSTAVRQKLGS